MRWAAEWTGKFPAGGDGEVGPSVRQSVSELHYAGVDLLCAAAREKKRVRE